MFARPSQSRDRMGPETGPAPWLNGHLDTVPRQSACTGSMNHLAAMKCGSLYGRGRPTARAGRGDGLRRDCDGCRAGLPGRRAP